MSSAAKPSRRIATRNPRTIAPGCGRLIIKGLSSGAAAVAISIAALGSILTGAGWLLSVSLDARSDIRIATGRAPVSQRMQVAWTDPVARETQRQQFAMAESSFADRFAQPPQLAPLGALTQIARVAPPTPAKPASPGLIALIEQEMVTGSIGNVTAKEPAKEPVKMASLDLTVPPVRPSRGPAIEDNNPPPLPRSRPKLASLTPLEDLGSKRQEELHPPRTAIYDISAQAVYLPNGERLEAHSGLGEYMDDPDSMRRRMRGVTPPNTYRLKLREAMFHGVQAIRLVPEREEDMFGRDGILAHTYMLGPNGQSNGCVSFKNYPRFLRAFQNGEIERIVVVPHLSKTPALARAAPRNNDSIF
jgi:hypothetical protein